MSFPLRKVSLVAMLVSSACSAQAAPTLFSNFTPLTGNVAAGSLPANAPFQLSSGNFTQTAIANRANQLTQAPGVQFRQLGHDHRQRNWPQRRPLSVHAL